MAAMRDGWNRLMFSFPLITRACRNDESLINFTNPDLILSILIGFTNKAPFSQLHL